MIGGDYIGVADILRNDSGVAFQTLGDVLSGCLTLGKDGALVFDCRNRSILYSDKPKGKVVSTVGAGDSFAACFLSSLLSGYKVEKCLDRAVTLSDFVVTQLGAVPDYDPSELFA